MHKPVLLQEVIKYLDPKPNQNFIDATVGDGGHASEILRHISPSGQVLGIDWDETAIKNLKGVGSNGVEKGEGGERGENKIVRSGLDTGSNAWEAEPPRTYYRSGIEPRSYPSPLQQSSGQARSGQVIGDLESRLVLKQGNFAEIKNIFSRSDLEGVAGVLFDLGLRTGQIEGVGSNGEKGVEKGEKGERGFSYKYNGPLDMRFDRSQSLTAAEIVNTWSEEELAKIFRELGEERNYKKIARAIATARQKNKITTTAELVEIIDKIHKSNRTYARVFQALRMAVNGELENIQAGLEGAWDVVALHGRIAVISFHSLEDRVVKNFFKEKQAAGAGEILTKKPARPSAEEIRANPKSRSAKLRVIQKIESRK